VGRLRLSTVGDPGYWGRVLGAVVEAERECCCGDTFGQHPAKSDGPWYPCESCLCTAFHAVDVTHGHHSYEIAETEHAGRGEIVAVPMRRGA